MVNAALSPALGSFCHLNCTDKKEKEGGPQVLTRV